MARIPMTSGFTLCPEGVHVFKIEDVKYDENFGKLEIHLVNDRKIKHIERYSLKNANDELNEGALNAFSYFAKTALRRWDIEDIDPAELIGHFIKAEVVHSQLPSKKDPSKMLTFANLGDKWECDGFETTAPSSGLDLDALLG